MTTEPKTYTYKNEDGDEVMDVVTEDDKKNIYVNRTIVHKQPVETIELTLEVKK